MEKQFDCLVVGAGPAGSSAARRLALSGRSVLILEKALMPRAKCCAGGLTPKVPRLLDFDLEPVVEQEVERGCFTYRNTRPLFPSTPPLGLKMVHRDRFDYLLVEQARAAGAEVWEGTTFLGLEIHRTGVEARTTRGKIRASVIVGADGPLSRVARFGGLWKEIKTAIALVRELRLPQNRHDHSRTYVLFDFGEVSGGYRWIFPKGDRLSLGLFSISEKGKNLKPLLESFPQDETLVGATEVLPLRGHPLPCFGVHTPLFGERIVLCGDAAGLVDPLTGEGIAQAIESGLLAAEVIHDFLAGKTNLSHYAQAIEGKLAQDLYYAGRLAHFIFGHPYLFYRLLVFHDWIASLLVQVMRGDISYREVYMKLKGRSLSRLYSLTKGVKTKVFGGEDP